ncbi:hypothetical protein OS493_020493 [Desmophyllum pertusum]|uniref:Uncharacterized protein n=1 Tax=Desmophyllum pertusum TaxID=174260 RepID=A0A9W9Z2L4_9CNID|nr:hypothetical protein OS493_020493 [Desmophyllum pertusum]
MPEARSAVTLKNSYDRPSITYVTTPSLLRIGQYVSLNCTASAVSPIHVMWYKGPKVLASGISEAVFALKNITDKDWGEFLCVAKNFAGEDKKSVILRILPESPKILNTKKKIDDASWTLRWSAVNSEGHRVTSYTVWHRVVHVARDNITREKPWLRENMTGLIYHKELAADTPYMFAVTAWNRWGESLLETDKILFISTDFPDRNTKKTDQTLHTEPETSVMPSNSKQESCFHEQN